MCEIDSNHTSFISKLSNKQYLEGYHLIPMSYQSEFLNSIDVESNVVALCPNCHKAFHHGTKEEIDKMIEKIFIKREKRLEKAGIITTSLKIKNYY